MSNANVGCQCWMPMLNANAECECWMPVLNANVECQRWMTMLNAKDECGQTAFHYACTYGYTTTVRKMMDNAELFGLDLTAKDNDGNSGFHLAKYQRCYAVVNMIKRKMPRIAVINWLVVKNLTDFRNKRCLLIHICLSIYIIIFPSISLSITPSEQTSCNQKMSL